MPTVSGEGPGEPTADREDATTTGSDVGTPNTLVNGIVGGVVGVILFFIPFSTVLGGAVAGYLEGGEPVDGVKVGAIAGIVALLPLLLVMALIGLLAPVAVGAGPRFPLALGVMLLFVVALVAVYVVGLSVVGGILGVYLHDEL